MKLWKRDFLKSTKFEAMNLVDLNEGFPFWIWSFDFQKNSVDRFNRGREKETNESPLRYWKFTRMI